MAECLVFDFKYKIIIFRLNKQKDDIRSTYVYYKFFRETVDSQPHSLSHFRAS